MGIMKGKNKIDNIEIKGNKFLKLKEEILEELGIENVSKIIHVCKAKSVYEVVLGENKSLRLDILKGSAKAIRRIHYQSLAYENKVNVPKLIGFFDCKHDGNFYKVSEWITGIRVGHVWNKKEMFRNAGRQVAKINSIKDSYTGLFLGYNDFSKPNAIWTKDEKTYLIDVVILPKQDVDFSTIKLFKNFKSGKRIRWFLDGYSEIRNTSRILKEMVPYFKI